MINQYTTKQKKNKIIKSYIFLFLSALIYTMGFQIFLQNAKTLAVGITAFASFWTFIFKDLNSYVSIIVIVFNIPLLIFSIFKNKKRFTRRTTFFLIIQGLISLLFFIPEANEWIKNNILIKSHKSFGEEWIILIHSIIGSLLMGFGISVSWMSGGSVGGTDIITYYYSSKYKKDIGKTSGMISFIILLFSFVFTIVFNQEIRNRWLITLFSSFIFIFIVSIIISHTYPKYKKVEVIVSSEMIEEIDKNLKEKKYEHSWIIEKKNSGFSKREKKEIKSIMFLLELKEFVRFVKKIDEKAFISTKIIYKLFGDLSNRRIEEYY